MKNQSSILAATNFHAALMKRKPAPWFFLFGDSIAKRPTIKKTEAITVMTRAVHLPIFSKQDLMHAGAPRWTHAHSTAYL